MANAIGILETKGLTALVKGVDAMLKAANVTLAGQYKDAGSAYVSAYVTGDVASVKAAIEAGSAGSEVGKVVSVDVIARPHEDLSKTVLAAAAAKAPAKK